jgi:hypothetical protein
VETELADGVGGAEQRGRGCRQGSLSDGVRESSGEVKATLLHADIILGCGGAHQICGVVLVGGVGHREVRELNQSRRGIRRRPVDAELFCLLDNFEGCLRRSSTLRLRSSYQFLLTLGFTTMQTAVFFRSGSSEMLFRHLRPCISVSLRLMGTKSLRCSSSHLSACRIY